jgi:RHS repeat-associated protein
MVHDNKQNSESDGSKPSLSDHVLTDQKINQGVPMSTNQQATGKFLFDDQPMVPNERYKHIQAPAVAPDIAKNLIESRPMPKIWQPPTALNLAGNTAQGAPSIVEMARALKNDPELIYEFVYNNIEHAPGYGQAKGALGTLLDGAGSSFDQCSLLAALLRQAGFTANYEIGQVQINPTQAAAWLGCDTGFFTAWGILSAANIPVTVNDLFDPKIVFSHCWLRVNIGTALVPNWVVMDPSFKTYTTKTSIDLATAMGYSQSTLLTQARSGYTIDGAGNWVQNVNRGNVRSQLNTLSSNLISWIKTNNPGASTDDIIGGRQIIPITLPIAFPATLPNQLAGDVPTEFTGDFSTAYKVTLRVQYTFGGIDVTLTSDQLCGHRLTFFFTPSGGNFIPVIALDGVTVATGTAQSANISFSVTLTVTHNAFATPFVQSGAPIIRGPNANFVTGQDYYLIATSFGPTGKGNFDYHNALQLQNEFNAGGASETLVDEPALGERMAAQWANYGAQISRTSDILNQMVGKVGFEIHAFGLVGYTVYGSPTFSGFNLSGGAGSGADLTSTPNPLGVSAGCAGGMHGYALEMLAIQQLTGSNAAVSTTRDLDVASAAGTKIWKGTPSTWTSTVRPALTGYTSDELSNIDFNVGFGSNVLLADTAGQSFNGHWTLHGYELFTGNGASGYIVGSYAGGLDTGWWPGFTPPKCKDCEEEDPVNIRTGDYIYRHNDITIGSGSYPYQLSFYTSYDSRARLSNGPLGLGWTHNWAASARLSSDGLRAMGSYSPISAAASIVEIFVSLDLLSDTALPVDKMVIVSLSNQWWVDQLTGNTVTVSMPDDEDLIFTLLTDGTYVAPDDNAATLTLSAGAYTMTTPQKVVYSFNNSGQLVSIVFPFGVTIALTYSAGLLTSISNGLGRTLTLHYTGSQITSVTDGTGRSVAYTIDGANQLTKFTDAMLADTTFSYVSPGLMNQYFLPQNPTNAVVTNTFDTLNRIASQVDIDGHVRNCYLAGSRSEFVNPNNFSEVSYFDGRRNTTKRVDELGFATLLQYDGLGRLVQRTQPEGNSTIWTFDSKNNVLTETKVPKSGSGLSNIVSTWTYDATYNKMHTVLDPRGNTWTWNYDATTGSLLSFVKPIVGGLTPQETWTYNSRGQVLTYTDETAVVTQSNYDVATEKLTSVVVDFGITPHLNLTTAFGYDSVGNITTVTDPNNNQISLAFDNNRRLTQKTDPTPFSYVTKYGFDLNGNLTSVQRQITSTPTYQTYTIVYTLSDKVFTMTDPALNVTTKTYDSLERLWTVKDAEDRLSTFSYDARSKLSTVLDATSTSSETRLYTNNGLLASIKDANNNLTQYTRDGFDRLDKTTYADSSFEENQAYDANGNVLTYRTRSGNTIVNTFDVLNRLSTKTPTGQAVVTFGYDLHNRLLSESTPVVGGNPASGSFQFSYDTAGRLKQETTPDSKNTQYQFDANGNLTVLTYPDGYFATRIYDQLNRLTDIKLNGAGAAAVHLTYDQLSRRSVLTYGNGATSTYTFQLNDDLTGLVDAFTGSSVAFTYGFNKVHQETSRSVTDGSYLWHPATVSTVSYAVANNVNEYPTVGGVNYLYDGNANLTSDGVWTYTFDTENHLLTANKTGVSASYVYDPAHRQIQKTVGSTKTRYVYSGWQRIADYDGTANTLQNRYIYGVGLDEPLIQVTSAGVLTYLHSDRLGSVIATTDSTGTVTNKSKYSPFGENVPVGTTFGFTGQRYDAETGLYYYKNRHYSPAVGRFLQTDPIGYGIKLDDCGCGCSCTSSSSTQASVNLYGYVSNDPLNFVDLLGLDPLQGSVQQTQGKEPQLNDSSGGFLIDWALGKGKQKLLKELEQQEAKQRELIEEMKKKLKKCKTLEERLEVLRKGLGEQAVNDALADLEQKQQELTKLRNDILNNQMNDQFGTDINNARKSISIP